MSEQISDEIIRNVGEEAINVQSMAASIHALLSAIPDEAITESLFSARQLALQIEDKMKSILEMI